MILLFLAIIVTLFVCFSLRDTHEKEKNQTNTTASEKPETFESTKSWREANTYSFSGYSGPTRYWEGKPVRNNEDLEKWEVMRGFADAIKGHLEDLEDKLGHGQTDNPTAVSEEWHEFYQRYRKLCIEHHWENYKVPNNLESYFVPNSIQLAREKEVFQRIEELRTRCELLIANKVSAKQDYDRRSAEILEYLQRQPDHSALKSAMMRELSGNDPAAKRLYESACSQMEKDKRVSIGQLPNGRYFVKKRRSAAKQPENKYHPLTPSFYKPEMYKNIPAKVEYRVLYTVGKPQHLDTLSNTCEFVSLSTGDHYSTSLENCTCPACRRTNGKPCKHMIALARYLGHYTMKYN